MKKFAFLFLLVSTGLSAQVPFSKGVNVTTWFQAPSAQRILFWKYTKKDFEQIKSLGADVIRLPINLHGMTNGEPSYKLDPLFFEYMDQVVDWAEELQLFLILDNHSFSRTGKTEPDVVNILSKVWIQMAEHYKDRSDYILYEILNEPTGIEDVVWGKIQQQVIDSIRTIDKNHFIIVGGSNWNSFHNLAYIPVYKDPKLIYTFHFYDPFVFTHQGAGWPSPSLDSINGVPFPYASGTSIKIPTSASGTWLEEAIKTYPTDGSVENMKAMIDIAVEFQRARNVPIFCGEFGVYMKSSAEDDRVFWYEEVRKYFNEKNIPWTMWDYKNSFGLFTKGSLERFDQDLNVPLLEALEFKVPASHQNKK